MTAMKSLSTKGIGLILMLCLTLLWSPSAMAAGKSGQIINSRMQVMKADPAPSENGCTQQLTGFNLQVKQWAFQCRDEIVKLFNSLIASNRLTLSQLFDTFYIPIPNTSPQKYHTDYDMITDKYLRIIEDKYVAMDKRIVFVVAVDVNGYLPTHDSRYSQPLTGNPDYDLIHNRTKRIFDDTTGLKAARNTQPYLLQSYHRDTGKNMYDLSVPIFVDGKHWGGLRIGYFEEAGTQRAGERKN